MPLHENRDVESNISKKRVGRILTIFVTKLNKKMKLHDVIVIGGGAAGMICAIEAAKGGAKVLLLEKMERVGRKVLITGKGRCNLTNTKEWEEFSSHIYPNKRFLKHSFYAFNNKDLVSYFESLGVKCVVERGDRVFPADGRASTIVEALVKEMTSAGVEILYKRAVDRLIIEGEAIVGVGCGPDNFYAKAVVVATGALSYPATGSQGDGYKLAKQVGHTITPLFPSLTALMPKNYNKKLEGLSLKNIALSLFVGGDKVQSEFGEIEFTNNGLEGSLGFRVSRRAVKAMTNGNRCYLMLDLKPAVDIKELNDRVVKEISLFNMGAASQFLTSFMPKSLIDTFILENNIPTILDAKELPRVATLLSNSMKNWKIEIESYTSYERAVVTAGGLSLEEINPKSMCSKLHNNLFFAGEVIDLDGDTGGYNLQIAFTTGFVAGNSVAYFISKPREEV